MARLQIFEEPNIQRSGVRRRIDIAIGGVILLFRISYIYKVSTRLNTYQNILKSFDPSRHNTVLGAFIGIVGCIRNTPY